MERYLLPEPARCLSATVENEPGDVKYAPASAPRRKIRKSTAKTTRLSGRIMRCKKFAPRRSNNAFRKGSEMPRE